MAWLDEMRSPVTSSLEPRLITRRGFTWVSQLARIICSIPYLIDWRGSASDRQVSVREAGADCGHRSALRPQCLQRPRRSRHPRGRVRRPLVPERVPTHARGPRRCRPLLPRGARPPHALLHADGPMTSAFLTVIEAFVTERDLGPVPFEPGVRKDDPTREYLRT